MKIHPMIKNQHSLTSFEDLEDGSVFLFPHKGLGLWIAVEKDNDRQSAVNLGTGEELTGLCGGYVIVVDAEIAWEHIRAGRGK